MAFDFNALGKNDKVALVAGALTTILLFIPAYAKASVEGKGVAASIGSQSESKSAFVEWATIGALLLIVAFVIVVLRLVVGNLPAGVPWNLITAAVAGLGTLLLVIYVFTFGVGDVPDSVKDSVNLSTGPGWSGWILIVAAIVFTAFSFLGFKDSGEQIPDFNKGNDAPPAPPTA